MTYSLERHERVCAANDQARARGQPLIIDWWVLSHGVRVGRWRTVAGAGSRSGYRLTDMDGETVRQPPINGGKPLAPVFSARRADLIADFRAAHAAGWVPTHDQLVARAKARAAKEATDRVQSLTDARGEELERRAADLFAIVQQVATLRDGPDALCAPARLLVREIEAATPLRVMA